MAEFVEDCAAQNLMKDNFRSNLVQCQEDLDRAKRSYKTQGWIQSVLWFFVGFAIGDAVGK